jgi:tRNA U34 2-thiouridine synthase MnmA/TrmU
VGEEFLEIVKKPKHGYGSNMNPCIDCRILLFKKAKEHLAKVGASFVITGEVLGQRPMSQKLHTMELIEKEAGLEGLVLRPLSAKLLEETIPEKEGWVARDKLLAIAGRGRKEQFSLAHEFGIHDYPCPSGGCLLTDPEFSKRLKDLMKHQDLDLADIQLLKVGRHFRLSDKTKLVVGRNELENQRLLNLAKDKDLIFSPPEEIAGPTVLGRGLFDEALIDLSCKIACRYCDKNPGAKVKIAYRHLPDTQEAITETLALEEEELVKLRI